jgi:hypothetical protein
MRMIFGLVALLVTVAIILFVASMYYGGSRGVIKTGARLQDEATQISGRGPDKVPVTQSITYLASSGGRLDALEVESVTAGGAMELYGVRAGDQIVEVNGIAMRDVPMGDEELAKAWVAEAYQRQQSLVVMRGGQRIELPQAATPAAPAAPTASPVQRRTALPSAGGDGAPAGGAARRQAESVVNQLGQTQQDPEE